jgi:hypothetical protein
MKCPGGSRSLRPTLCGLTGLTKVVAGTGEAAEAAGGGLLAKPVSRGEPLLSGEAVQASGINCSTNATAADSIALKTKYQHNVRDNNAKPRLTKGSQNMPDKNEKISNVIDSELVSMLFLSISDVGLRIFSREMFVVALASPTCNVNIEVTPVVTHYTNKKVLQ